MRSSSALLIRSLAASLVLGLATALSGADARVYVAFKSSAKGPVQAAIAASGGKVHHEFDELGAMAASIPEQAIAGLSHNPHVEYLEIDPPRFLFNLPGDAAQSTPYGIEMVKAPATLDAIGAVAPIKVGVIDSGVFKGHLDLQGVAISGYASSGQNYDVDLDSHGTHVTGTIAAADNGVGVVGVAPGVASIYMVKVFGDTGEWVYSSDLLSAAIKAQAAGSRIISMSLGGSLSSRTEKNGMADLYTKKNVLLVAAAGNDGNNRNSYPASYDSVISVAAIDANKSVASFSQYNNQVELAAPGVAVLSTTSYYENVSATSGGTSYSGNTIEFAARSSGVSGTLVDGGLATGTNAAWAGKVVLVSRGTNSFYEKVVNVQNSGGLAAIIYNNVDGDLFATLGEGNSSTIPAIGLSQADGQALLASAGTSTTVVSTLATSTSGYSSWDGTSMATPHVSGAAALIWAKYPTATAQQVRQALDETAEDRGAAGRDAYYGFGIVNARAALDRLATLAPGSGGGAGDTAAPILSAITASATNTKNGSFQITWTTDEPATSVVSFVGGSSYSNTTLVTSHKMTFRGTKGGTYRYTVTSADAFGNSVTSPEYTFVNK